MFGQTYPSDPRSDGTGSCPYEGASKAEVEFALDVKTVSEAPQESVLISLGTAANSAVLLLSQEELRPNTKDLPDDLDSFLVHRPHKISVL